MTDSLDTEVATEVPEPDVDEPAEETSAGDTPAPGTETTEDGGEIEAVDSTDAVDGTEAADGTADTDETGETNEADGDRPTDHLEDVGDGCGCAEIWEHLSDEE